MKRIISMISIVLVLAIMFGCASKNKEENRNISENTTPATQELKIKDYFPIMENVRYIYDGKGNEYASYDVHVDYTSDNKVQLRINNGGTEMAEVFVLQDGKLKRVLSRGEAYYRESLLQANADKDEVILMEPLTTGTSWTLSDSSVRKITNTSADVTTPSGNYKAIEVVTEGKNDKIITYYAKGVGLVKSVFVSGDSEITSSLSKIEENVSLVQKISFFYPDVNNEKIYYKEKDIDFKTNDITKQKLEAAYKESGSNNLNRVFSANTKINSLYLNKDGMVYLDLNKAFVTEMNAGTLYESMILQCIANTFGRYYNSDKVVLTIDNKPYESGHIIMEKGEYLKVKYESTVQAK